MSGCADVCLSHDYDCYNSFYSESWRKARKPHKCCECGVIIEVGEQYEHVSGKADGRIFTAKTCAVCQDIRAAFVCGTWVFGDLWQSMYDYMMPVWRRVGPWDCLAKLTRQDAVDECVRRFNEYMEEYDQ